MVARTVYTIDAETDPFDGTTNINPFIWDIYDGKKHYTMESVADCHHFIKTHPGVYFAHNGGKFDYMLNDFTSPIESKSEVLIINGRVAKFTMLGSEFRDSFCILPSPLSEIGGKLDIDYAKLHRDVRSAHMPEIIRYLHADTEVLRAAVLRFRADYGPGLTLAGCAIKQLQKILKIKVMPRLLESNDRLLRDYYYGGRVEAFKKGVIKKPFKVFDIVSAYPAAMLETHGWGDVLHADVPSICETIIKQAFYHVHADSRGAFPVRDKKGIHFPHSKGYFKVTGWELSAGLALKNVTLIRVVERLRFLEEKTFTPYVAHFFAMKAAAAKGSPERLHAKLFLNSAYGKLGADPREYKTYVVCDAGTDVESYRACGYEASGWLGGRPLMAAPLEKDEWRFLHVGAAASVTGYVRAKLMTQMQKIRESGADILYCDTDSIAAIGGDMETGTKPGEWTVDADCVEGAIAGKKMYAFKQRTGTFKKEDGPWKISSKGVRLDHKQIYAVAKGGTVTFCPSAPSFGIRKPAAVITPRKIKRT